MYIQWPTTMGHSLTRIFITPIFIRRCTPLYKHVDNGSITFWERKGASTLITSYCNSCRHKETYIMIVIISGPHICSNAT